MSTNPNISLPSDEIQPLAREVVALGIIAVEAYTSPGPVAEVPTDVATLGAFNGFTHDQMNKRPVE